MKRSTLAIVLVAILVLGVVGVTHLWPQSEKSNALENLATSSLSTEWRDVPDIVVVILIDTLRKDFLTPENAPFICNELKPDCLSYENAYSNSSWTVPAVASLFTGLLAREHGADFNSAGDAMLTGVPCGSLGSEHTTIAEIFSEHGYFTIASIGISVLKAVSDFSQGFQAFQCPDGMVASDVVNSFALANLGEEHQKVFAYIHYSEPHAAYGNLNPTEEPYFYPVMRDQQSLNDAERAALIEAYCEEIRTVDRAVAEVVGYLKDHNLYDSALLLLISDHGESFGESNFLRHGVLLEEHLVHVPFLVKYPHNARIGKSLDYIQLSDIAFLLLEGTHFRRRRVTIEISVQPNPFAADVAPERFNRAMYLTIEPKTAAISKAPESSQAFILKSLGYLR